MSIYTRKTTVIYSNNFFLPTEMPHGRHENKAYGKSGNMVVEPVVEDICKNFGTITYRIQKRLKNNVF